VKTKNHSKNNKRLIVKFGGASLSSGELILKAAKAVANAVRKGSKVVAVVSATGKSTDNLIELAKGASGGKISTHELDDVLSMGERASARIFAAALNAQGIQSRYFDPTDTEWPIITNENFTNADPLIEECDRRIRRQIVPLLNKGVVPVIPGFIGRSLKAGRITTIGRGGSDATAFILAKAVGAKEVVLVTDVQGIMSADPKLVKNTRFIDKINVDKLVGLADAGTKFIHRRALKHKANSIDVRIVSHTSGRLNVQGTLIKGSLPELEVELAEQKPVMLVTFVGEGLAESPRIIPEIAKKIRSCKISILGMTANHDSVIFYSHSTEDKKKLERLHSVVLRHKETLAMAVKRNLAFIKVKGVGLEETPGIIGRVSAPLHKNSINIFGIFTITSSVMVFVDWEDRNNAIKLIKESLGMRESPC